MTEKEARTELKRALEVLKESGHIDNRRAKAFDMAFDTLGLSERIHFNPFPEYDKLFKEVEEALGFKLFTWQKTYIVSGFYRQSGSTTAQILQRLLFDKTPLDLSQRPRNNKERIEFEFTKEILDKLVKADIETCEIIGKECLVEKPIPNIRTIRTLCKIRDELKDRVDYEKKLMINDKKTDGLSLGTALGLTEAVEIVEEFIANSGQQN